MQQRLSLAVLFLTAVSNVNSQILGNWTWIHGDNTINAVGIYGTKNMASGLNVPGARRSHTVAMDS